VRVILVPVDNGFLHVCAYDSFIQPHWLPVYYRIQYKLCLLMYYSVSHQHCPAYIGDMVQSVATSIPTVKVRSPVFHMPNVRRRRTKN